MSHSVFELEGSNFGNKRVVYESLHRNFKSFFTRFSLVSESFLTRFSLVLCTFCVRFGYVLCTFFIFFGTFTSRFGYVL